LPITVLWIATIEFFGDFLFESVQTVLLLVNLVACIQQLTAFGFGVQDEDEAVQVDERTIVNQFKILFVKIVLRVLEVSLREDLDRLVDVVL